MQYRRPETGIKNSVRCISHILDWLLMSVDVPLCRGPLKTWFFESAIVFLSIIQRQLLLLPVCRRSYCTSHILDWLSMSVDDPVCR